VKLIQTLFIGALFSFPASDLHACAVDGVEAKTDTTITISWNVSGCNKLSAGATFRVCWKNAANSGNTCIEPTLEGHDESGTTTITGLLPSTAYKIRTQWHHRSTGWHDVTTRIVSTNPSPTSVSYALRYERETGRKYCVHFFWKAPPSLPTPLPFELKLAVFHWELGNWKLETKRDVDTSGATSNPATQEYTTYDCTFRNSRRYHAELVAYFPLTKETNIVSNTIEWK
jgi:hypothetical protein